MDKSKNSAILGQKRSSDKTGISLLYRYGKLLGRIAGSHTGGYEVYHLLGYKAV
jgi:hypothetical protein